MSVGTLCQHFPSQEALLIAALEVELAAIDGALSQTFALPAAASLPDVLGAVGAVDPGR